MAPREMPILTLLSPDAAAHNGAYVASRAVLVKARTVKKLTEDFQTALTHAEVAKKLADAGFEVMATDGPALNRFAREQYERWADFVKRTNLKMEE